MMDRKFSESLDRYHGRLRNRTLIAICVVITLAVTALTGTVYAVTHGFNIAQTAASPDFAFVGAD